MNFYDMTLNLEVILVCVILYLQKTKNLNVSKNRKILLFIHDQ